MNSNTPFQTYTTPTLPIEHLISGAVAQELTRIREHMDYISELRTRYNGFVPRDDGSKRDGHEPETVYIFGGECFSTHDSIPARAHLPVQYTKLGDRRFQLTTSALRIVGISPDTNYRRRVALKHAPRRVDVRRSPRLQTALRTSDKEIRSDHVEGGNRKNAGYFFRVARLEAEATKRIAVAPSLELMVEEIDPHYERYDLEWLDFLDNAEEEFYTSP